MKLKVCGITDSEQFIKINELGVDMIGLNFYKPSKRYIEQFERSKEIPMHATSKRVGVFVNHSKDEILAKQESYKLDYAQLHGDEDLDFCKALNKFIKIIKVWRIKDRIEEFNQIRAFEDYVSFHLFDTYTTNYGGSGVAFNWQILNQLTLTKPFMLSGGISTSAVIFGN